MERGETGNQGYETMSYMGLYKVLIYDLAYAGRASVKIHPLVYLFPHFAGQFVHNLYKFQLSLLNVIGSAVHFIT